MIDRVVALGQPAPSLSNLHTFHAAYPSGGRCALCILGGMSVGTPFHPRTAALNRKMQWREWSGYFASSVYADAHDIEYNAIREAAALIDVSPLYKYRVAGSDATRLVDRVITRDATPHDRRAPSTTRRGATSTAR